MQHQVPERVPSVYADEQNNLIFITKSKNPDYVEPIDNDPKSIEASLPMYLAAPEIITLRFPYTTEQVAKAIQTIVEEWDRHPPFEDDGRDDIELYYGMRNFKKASFGKKFIEVYWSKGAPKGVSLLLPCKTPRMWMGIEKIDLDPDASWIDYAEAVISLVRTDVTTYRRFKLYKRYLNLTPPKTK